MVALGAAVARTLPPPPPAQLWRRLFLSGGGGAAGLLVPPGEALGGLTDLAWPLAEEGEGVSDADIFVVVVVVDVGEDLRPPPLLLLL